MGGRLDPDPTTEAVCVDQEDGRPKVAIVVEYEGTRYHGFQIQAHGQTIQSELERVLRAVTQEECRIVGAGRTDAGVHARGQVAHFKTNWRHPWAELGRALNALLPDDIAVRKLAPVAPAFHARRSAQSRWYRYSIFTRSIRSPFSVRHAYHLAAPLEVEAMNAAAASLIGRHDFATFGQAPNGGHTIREIYVARWQRDQEWIFFDVEANAFLRRMVRSLVGTLLRVGSGEISPVEFAAILAARERSAAGVTAPPQGLCLERVVYGPPWQELGIETQSSL
jgi:tRNA pseudouridine38-40 synthase